MECAVGMYSEVDAARPCEDGSAMACPANATKQDGVCECDAGYDATEAVLWSTTGGGWTGTCTAGSCSSAVPAGAGFGSECAGLVTDATCTHRCIDGYLDNGNGNGQTYTCPGGVLSGTLLICSAAECAVPGEEAGRSVSGCEGKVTGDTAGCTVSCDALTLTAPFSDDGCECSCTGNCALK